MTNFQNEDVMTNFQNEDVMTTNLSRVALQELDLFVELEVVGSELVEFILYELHLLGLSYVLLKND